MGKFSDFNRRDIVYTTVAAHPIEVSIFTPKTATNAPADEPQSAPVLVYWHGGGFIVGDRLYKGWWPDWLLEFALSQNALIIAPDYRLLPEATGADILDDMDAFWAWFLQTLPGIAESENWTTRPDLDRIICAGHSAGGSIALYSALQRPDAGIKAVVTLYAPLYYNVPELKMARPRPILGTMPPPPRQAEAQIRAYVQKTRGTVRTRGDVLEMWGLVACILQQGRLPRMMAQRPDPRLDALKVIEKGTYCPPIWVIHGENDSVVPMSCSTEFVKRLPPEVPRILSVRPGEHNFDASLTMQEPWLAEGCGFLRELWGGKEIWGPVEPVEMAPRPVVPLLAQPQGVEARL
ncbi:Alpha/Beta hydrolase protein [Aspergillus multicolor]|uniref:Alpha/Beta hydrolase protein n=1 Tax=Aspergillus multicolor TaxID=41759 RepID=UPI003CCD5B43